MHDGFVINIGINREIWLAAAYGTADLIHLYAADLEAEAAIPIKRLDQRVDVVGEPLARWAQYPAGIAWALKRRGLKVHGINAVFMGNLAMQAGLSSSAAVEEAFAVAWQSLAGWQTDLRELALAGQETEREYIGVGSGIQDQFTCLHASQDHVLWLDCRNLNYRQVRLPSNVKAVICDTNTRRELVGSGFTERAQDAHAAAHTISLVDTDVKRLRDVTPERLRDFEDVLTPDQYRRARHVVTEIARVEQAIRLLEQGDVRAFGDLMHQSYHSARRDYGSSSPALDAMWQAASAHPGCYGARYSGGGKGGVVIALVEADAVDDFCVSTAARYHQATGITCTLFAADPAQGAGVFQ
jgi:galactokinase